ncbi:MAG: ATP-dependent helicase [Acidobacteriaceae bacterium]
MDFLSKLNPQQREAVETVDGPVLILAGAGSGKTRVITYRIAHLVEDVGVAPDSILAVTFTNKAASEMAERVDKLVGGRTLAKPTISTFHSFCVRALRRDINALQVNGKGFTKDFVIYDEADQQLIVKAALRRLGVDDKKVTPRSILSHISWAKNHMLDPEDVYLNSRDPNTEKVAQVYQIYKQELAKANALDFDDLLLQAVRLLKLSEPTREKYQRRYHYLLVDEYQDTNRPQYEIMKSLTGKRHNICAVGDEDQSIYSWRGADIRNILEFEQDFPEAKIIRLEQNYRSTQNILEGASAVVRNNVKRKGKNLWTDRQGGSKIGYYEAPDGENEALFAADYISKYLQKRAEEGENARAAVLYRTNSQSRLFEEALRRYGLQYHVVGGFSFYERAEIKDMISYLKLILNLDDSIALQRVVNTPARGIGKTSMETVERIALETGKSLWGAIGEVVERQLLPSRACQALKSFRELIEDARAMAGGTYADRLSSTLKSAKTPEKPAAIELPEVEVGDQHGFGFEGSIDFSPEALSDDATDFSPESLEDAPAEEGLEGEERVEGFRAPGEAANVAEIIKFLIDRTGYIGQLEQEDTPESLSRIENLKELVNAAMDSRDRGETIGDFLDHAALVSDTDQYEASQQITLMTLHSAKGLEFPLVFLVGLEEGLFPHSRTLLSPDDMEEERRLCYVGMTRAMDTLVVTRARYRRRWGTDMPEASTPSRFLEEIPPQLMEDLGSPGGAHRERVSMYDTSSGHRRRAGRDEDEYTSTHYDYENEDQSGGRVPSYSKPKQPVYTGSRYNSIDNIAEFFASRGKKFSRPKIDLPEPTGKKGFQAGARVIHPKYGEGTVVRREGDGDEAKITVQFARHGMKKLVEKFAQLQKA